MNPKEYVKNVLVTENREMNPLKDRFSDSRNIRLLHGAIGLASELAEMREMVSGKELDAVNLKEEAGDMFWYMGIMVDELKVNPESVFSDGLISSLGIKDPDTQKDMLSNAVDNMTKNIGNAVDLLKKAVIYGKPLDEAKLVSRLSALDHNISEALYLFGIKPSDARARNIEKLRARYGEKFSAADALERDLAKERKILES